MHATEWGHILAISTKNKGARESSSQARFFKIKPISFKHDIRIERCYQTGISDLDFLNILKIVKPSKAPLGMNEREGIDVLKGVYSYTCAREDNPILCKFIVNGPLTTHHFSAQSVQPFPRYGGEGAHVHPTINLCKTLS